VSSPQLFKCPFDKEKKTEERLDKEGGFHRNAGVFVCFTMTVPSVYTYLSDVSMTSLIVLTFFGAN